MKLKSYLALTTLAASSAIVVTVTAAIFFMIQYSHDEAFKARGLELARVIAHDPKVRAAVTAYHGQPQSPIQGYIEAIRSKTDASYIVVVDRNGLRLSHPNPDNVGQPFVGEDLAAVLRQGKEYSSVAEGTLGPAIRNFSPIRVNGEVIGAVSIGYLQQRATSLLLAQFSRIGLMIAAIYLLGIGITGFFVLKMKRTFLDYEAEYIVNKFREHEMVLDSIRDAIIAVDHKMTITTVNQSATTLLSMGVLSRNDFLQQPLSNFSAVLSHLVLTCKGSFHQGEFHVGKLRYRANIYPIDTPKGNRGHVVVCFANLRQKELEKELAYLKNYAELLRSKTHEYSNKLNVLSGMLQLGKYTEAIDFVQMETDSYQSIIRNIVMSVTDSAVAGLLLAKFSKASDMGVAFELEDDSVLSRYSDDVSEKFVTMLGNLIDNALLAAWQHRAVVPPKVQVYLSDRSNHIILEVQDSGAGIPGAIAESILEFGVSSKSEHEQTGIGLYLVNKLVSYFHGSLDWDRTEEGTTLFSIYLNKQEVING